MNKVAELLARAKSLPQESGCYLMHDKSGRVIYVGKAKKLRSRVTSYFDSSLKSLKTDFLVSHIHDFDFMITHSEAESYVLENNLIKKHRPKYNIRLKDDKSYPWVLISRVEDFPRLEFVRRPKKSRDHELFGPFPTGSNISMVMRVLTKSFALRDCSLTEFKSRKDPCLLYQMHQCSAPCVGKISQAEYTEDLSMVRGFFQSPAKARKALGELKNKMQHLAESEEFERAALIRDNIDVLEQFLEQSYRQQVESLKDEKDVDIWSYFKGSDEADFSLYMIRGGMLLGQKNFNFLSSSLEEDLAQELQGVLMQYYSDEEQVMPEKIILDADDNELESFQTALQSLSEKEFKVQVHGRTKKYLPLLEMCNKHAEEIQRHRLAVQDSPYVGLNKLKELLSLRELPRHLECYDIAIWQGSSPTASQVVSIDGKLDKTLYRHYHMQELPEGNNDFAMMREVISRRLKHGELPDVFVIDGGVAQVNVVCSVLREMQIDVPVVGIAKSRDLVGDFKQAEIVRSDERLVIPNRKDPYLLHKNPSLMKIIVTLRDEAHRFSRCLHHKTESKRIVKSWVEGIKGLSAKSKKTILENLTLSREELAEMKVDEISRLLGIELKEALKVAQHLSAEPHEN